MNGQPDIVNRLYSDLIGYFHGGRSLSPENEVEMKKQMSEVLSQEFKQKIRTQPFYDAKLRG